MSLRPKLWLAVVASLFLGAHANPKVPDMIGQNSVAEVKKARQDHTSTQEAIRVAM